MGLRNDETGWGWPARWLHWVMALLMTGMLAVGLVAANLIADTQTRFDLVQLHKSFGFVVFILALLRAAWRITHPAPPDPPSPRWQAAAASASHLALYVLMFALPLSGWLLASASEMQDMYGIENQVFGLFALPDPFVPGDPALEVGFRRLHLALGLSLAALLAVHSAAALHHHYVSRDDVLMRMLRGRRRG